MPKKIAVLVRDRQSEALRISVGITIMDDIIDVYILDRKLEETEENSMNLEALIDLGMHIYTNSKENQNITYISADDLSRKILEYDNILAY